MFLVLVYDECDWKLFQNIKFNQEIRNRNKIRLEIKLITLGK